jgi:hypothetical protein
MRTIAALLVATALASCAARPAAPSGGVEGTVTSGPTCPVERAESPCPPLAWTGTVRAMAVDGATYEATTDASGAYRLSLPDGAYVVTPVLEGAGPPTAASVAVTVSGGEMRTLDLQVDSGIR